MLLVLLGRSPTTRSLLAFGRKRLWHALFRPRQRTPSSSSVGRFGFSITRRYCTLVGAVFGDLLPTCTSSKGRWSTLQSTFSILEKPETETLAVGSGDLLRFPFFLFIPRFTAAFLALTNTNNKNNNKNRTHAHSHTPGDRRCGDPYAAAASADALQTRTGNDFRTPTHAHTRTQKQRHTAPVSAPNDGGATHASFSSMAR